MPPPIEAFPASQLENSIQYNTDGKLRKKRIDLRECELKKLAQYQCELNELAGVNESKVICKPVLRLFRKCTDGLMVETTAMEESINKE